MSFLNANVTLYTGPFNSIKEFSTKVSAKIKKNPGKTTFIVAGTIISGVGAAVYAGPIAAVIGSTGILGTTASGTVISTLSGAALRSASLSAIGGGSIAAGGGGMVGGTINIAIVGTTIGAAGTATAATYIR